MFIKITSCSFQDLQQITLMVNTFGVKLIDYDSRSALVECIAVEKRNHDVRNIFEKAFHNRIEIIRGGSVAVEALSICEQ